MIVDCRYRISFVPVLSVGDWWDRKCQPRLFEATLPYWHQHTRWVVKVATLGLRPDEVATISSLHGRDWWPLSDTTCCGIVYDPNSVRITLIVFQQWLTSSPLLVAISNRHQQAPEAFDLWTDQRNRCVNVAMGGRATPLGEGGNCRHAFSWLTSFTISCYPLRWLVQSWPPNIAPSVCLHLGDALVVSMEFLSTSSYSFLGTITLMPHIRQSPSTVISFYRYQ